jgi:hypothetical protein
MSVLFSVVFRWLRTSRVRTLKQERRTAAADLDVTQEVHRIEALRGKSEFPVLDLDYRTFRDGSDAKPAGGRAFKYVDHLPDLLAVPVRKQAPKLLRTIGICLALALPLGAQQGSITIYQATSPGSSANFNNTNPRDNAWTVMYNYSGSGSFSIELDCAPDATVAGGTPTPGAFTTCTNTVTGTNPSTSPNYGYITFVGYTPWVQLNLTAISSGNMTAVAVGFLAADPEGASGGGTSKQNCDPSTSPLTVTTATVALSASGLTQIIPATASHKVLVCSMGVSFASGVNFQLETGTGTNCGTGTAALTGTLQSITALSLDSTASILTPVSVAVCVNLGASVVGGGWVTYATD